MVLPESCEFFPPHCHLTLSLGSLGMNLFEFLHELFIAKIRVLGLSVGEDFVILACFVLTQPQRGTDRQTDGGTTRPWLVPGPGPRIASYAYWWLGSVMASSSDL